MLFELGCADLKLVERNLDDEEISKQLLLFHLQQAVEKFSSCAELAISILAVSIEKRRE